MFGIGSTELLVIFLVALVVLGPKSLPGIARTLGKVMGEFRRVTTEFQRTMNVEVAEEEHAKRKKEAEEELFGSGSETSTGSKTASAAGASEGDKNVDAGAAKAGVAAKEKTVDVTAQTHVDATSGAHLAAESTTHRPSDASSAAVPLDRPQEVSSPLAEALARAEAEAATAQKSEKSSG